MCFKQSLTINSDGQIINTEGNIVLTVWNIKSVFKFAFVHQGFY